MKPTSSILLASLLVAIFGGELTSHRLMAQQAPVAIYRDTPVAIVAPATATKVASAKLAPPMTHRPGRRSRAVLRSALENAPRVKPATQPAWQQRYLVGPGDSFDFSFYKRLDLLREKVTISPDGRISYLQAVGIKAAGRTVGELRKEIELVLAEYHNDPKVIISPVKLASKKISILGRVREPGVYPLDRPTTLIEAVALAKGLEIGAVAGAAMEIADLDYSFVVRNGRRLDVNLAKLFHEGDFSHNAYLQPNDYIYIASSLRNRFYVLGAVATPGQLRMPTRMTLTGAIALSGGFSQEAWKRDVLLIRGSLTDPETRLINVGKILAGLEQDIIIEPKDIIYVNKRPFLVLEKALDAAVNSFVQTLAAESINEAYDGFFEGDRAEEDAAAAAATDTSAADAVSADAAAAVAALAAEAEAAAEAFPAVTP